ncbi:MAG: shikimate kinase [Dehalococcoidia bacterium]|jgi:shikimate kinase
MNIVLIGMRGSGKTAVGKVLSQKLGRELVETDELVVARAGMSIPQIVAEHGWDKFRDIEAEVVTELAGRDNLIIATGGGVVTHPENLTILKKNGLLIWLTAGIDTLVQRVGDDYLRPPLIEGKSRREEMETIFAERRKLYKQSADINVDTEDRTPEEVVEAIIYIIVLQADSIINLLCMRGEEDD